MCQAGTHSSLHRLSDFFINGRSHLVVASKSNDTDDAKEQFFGIYKFNIPFDDIV